MIFKVPLSGGSLILPLSFPQALSREFRPLEEAAKHDRYGQASDGVQAI